MNYKIITTDELEQGTNLTANEFDYLNNTLEIDKGDFDVLSLFDGDPDYIKLDGEKGRGNVIFTKFDVKGTSIYIMLDPDYVDYDYDKAVNILKWWINGAENNLVDTELDNNWNDWNKVNQGVAYRGGSGYFYALYARK